MSATDTQTITGDATEKSSARAVAQKWGGAVTENSGFVAVPMALLRLQAVLGLSATDMLVLTNLLAHWWEADKRVYPRSTTIAKRMGVDKRTVQRSTQKLTRLGLMVSRMRGDGKREFQFTQLAEALAKKLPASLAIKSEEFVDA